MWIICSFIILNCFLVKVSYDKMHQKLFISQFSQLLSRTQLLAICNHKEQSIRYDQNKYTLKTDTYDEISLMLPDNLIKINNQSNKITFDRDGETKPNKIQFFWKDLSKDIFQSQLFYGHYRQKHYEK